MFTANLISRWPVLAMLAALLPLQPAPLPDGPAYTPEGQLKFPGSYPEWVFLGSGLDMSYTSDATDPNMSMFNNVFVNPGAYRIFKTTGHWPEGTMMVLENRTAASNASINKRGKTESSEVMGVEVHLKDSTHLKGDGWGFYTFDDKANGRLISRPAACYSCHEQHGAVDTTFTQFYPAALEIARLKKTLSSGFETETQKPAVAK